MRASTVSFSLPEPQEVAALTARGPLRSQTGLQAITFHRRRTHERLWLSLAYRRTLEAHDH